MVKAANKYNSMYYIFLVSLDLRVYKWYFIFMLWLFTFYYFPEAILLEMHTPVLPEYSRGAAYRALSVYSVAVLP